MTRCTAAFFAVEVEHGDGFGRCEANRFPDRGGPLPPAGAECLGICRLASMGQARGDLLNEPGREIDDGATKRPQNPATKHLK